MSDKQKVIIMPDVECAASPRAALRKAKLAERDRLTPDLRAQLSAMLGEHLFRLEAVGRARQVMIYVAFRSEVATLSFFAMFRARGIAVSAPLTLVRQRRLAPYLITDPDRDLRPGYCGIAEPDAGRLSPVAPAGIDIVLVPGAVFDRSGGRLGYGGGYYDRFLAQEAPQAVRIGLAFEMQVVDRVPVLAHDIRMHYLVTEQMIRKIEE